MIVWIASYPRSGNTFLRTILKDQFKLTTYSRYVGKGFTTKILDKQILPASIPELEKSVETYFIKTHELPADNNPAIYIVRDGRSALLSYAWFSLTINEGISDQEVSKEMLQARLHDMVVTDSYYAGWSGHVDAWTSRKALTSIVHFEQLIVKPIETTRNALVQLGLSLEVTPDARPVRSFEELHAIEPRFFRSGRTDSWKSEMPEKLHRLFWIRHGNTMTRMNYTSDCPAIPENEAQAWREYIPYYQDEPRKQHELSAKAKIIEELTRNHEDAQRTITALQVEFEEWKQQHQLDQERLVAKEQVIVKLLKYRQWSLRYWGGNIARVLLPNQVILNLVKSGRRMHYGLTRPRLLNLKHHPPKDLKIPRSYHVRSTSRKPLPKISIVTPSYNQAAFIESTIRSVIDQQYPHLEYIIQDAASTDGTAEILRQYADKLAHVESKQDGGQTNAVNIGFSKSSGEIMAYLNSDDILLPGALHYVGAFFAAHPEIDVVYGHRVLINEQGKEIGRWLIPQHNNEIQKWVDFIPQETMFWRRSVYERVGEFDESFRFALDWDYIIRMQEAGAKFHRLPRFIGGFRIHESQKTLAMQHVGDSEMARIRKRIHGYVPMWTEIEAKIRDYYRENIRLQILYRLRLIQ